MKEEIRELDVVALVRDQPKPKLVAGQVGTVVDVLETDAFEVEFNDDHGRTYTMATLKTEDLIVLHYPLITAI